jgi:hypothetical protein
MWLAVGGENYMKVMAIAAYNIWKREGSRGLEARATGGADPCPRF